MLSIGNQSIHQLLSKDRVFLRRLEALLASLGAAETTSGAEGLLWCDERREKSPHFAKCNATHATIHLLTPAQMITYFPEFMQPSTTATNFSAAAALADLSLARLRWLRWLAVRAITPVSAVPFTLLGWGARTEHLAAIPGSMFATWSIVNEKYKFTHHLHNETRKFCTALQFIGPFIAQDFSFATDGIQFVLSFQADISQPQAIGVWRNLLHANLQVQTLIFDYQQSSKPDAEYPGRALFQMILPCVAPSVSTLSIPDLIVVKSETNTHKSLQPIYNNKVGA